MHRGDASLLKPPLPPPVSPVRARQPTPGEGVSDGRSQEDSHSADAEGDQGTSMYAYAAGIIGAGIVLVLWSQRRNKVEAGRADVAKAR